MPEVSTPEKIRELMSEIIDPELGLDIVQLGMYKEAKVSGGIATVKVALTTKGCPLRAQIQNDITQRLKAMPDIDDVKLNFTELTQEEKAQTMSLARANIASQDIQTSIPQNTRVLLVASGKGGVGKSTITTNLAVALASQGFAVGLIDADIWGFSITRLLDLKGKLQVSKNEETKEGKILPHILEMGGNKKANGTGDGEPAQNQKGVLKVVSMGFLMDSEDEALMWRGLVLNRAVQHFFQDVEWGEMDYLLVDMPPGTGDVQMGIAKLLPRAEMIVVTTPAKNATKVTARAISMGRKNYLRIVGVIENMSEFTAPDGQKYELFGSGGGQMLADEAGVPFLGKIPLEPSISTKGDEGKPVVLESSNYAAAAFTDIAKSISKKLAPPLDMQSCTAINEPNIIQLGKTQL